MTAIALNRALRGSRRRIACLAAVLCLGGVVVVHHTPMDHMGMGKAMVMCLALLPAVALAVAGVLCGGWTRPRVRIAVQWPRVVQLAAPPLPRARSSPVRSMVLRL